MSTWEMCCAARGAAGHEVICACLSLRLESTALCAAVQQLRWNCAGGKSMRAMAALFACPQEQRGSCVCNAVSEGLNSFFLL